MSAATPRSTQNAANFATVGDLYIFQATTQINATLKNQLQDCGTSRVDP